MGPDSDEDGPPRVQVVALDVLETCVALEPLRTRFTEVGQPAHLLDTWFARTLRDGAVLAAAGGFHPFREVGAAALRTVTRDALDDDAVAYVLGGMSRLPAHPDLAPAVERLRTAGVRVMAVTNGGVDVARRLLEDAGVLPQLDHVLSIDDVGAWKPSPRVYHAAAARGGAPPDQTALVAAHAWDCHGARRAGLASGWVSRWEGRWPDVFDRPDVEGPDLVAVADALLARH
ncbi:MAG: haloacid dehalogenase type II [Actinomycetes bacterium]